MATSIVLLTSTSGIESITGDAARGTSLSRNVGSIYTVAIHTSNLQGRVYLEASLEVTPGTDDWFALTMEGLSTPYVAYPYSGPSTTVSGADVSGFTFKGNFTWIRARLDRDYLSIPNGADIAPYGFVDQIILSVNNYGSGPVLSPPEDGPIFAEGATTFLELTDTPDAISDHAVLVGLSNSVVWTSQAQANTSLFYTGSAFTWKPDTFKITHENTIVNATSLVITGDEVSLSNSSGVASLSIGSVTSTEWVSFQYSPGSGGNFNTSGVILDNTSGVEAEIIDPVNCLVEFTFTGRLFPPTSIAVMGQAQPTNEFNYTNVSSAIGTRKIAGGGTASSPTLMGDFSGPVTLQLRMVDTGASAAPGTRAKVIVMFKF